MTSMDNVEKRAVIKHCVRGGMTPNDTLKFMNQGNTGQSCKQSLAYKWHGRFSNGREDINDDKRAGRPVTSDSLKLAVASELSTDRRQTLDLSHGTMHKIITNDLGMRKISARWVPRLLSENEKNTCAWKRHSAFWHVTSEKATLS
ncbi:protein GVQW3-like [Mya arenaria]|uniref:protein GVQW3-like n=1 Tax=Mya arenaria TaxID=6604 RepID=UPI0022E6329A|nr:protein GVQW3-like [Mya arenaria]